MKQASMKEKKTEFLTFFSKLRGNRDLFEAFASIKTDEDAKRLITKTGAHITPLELTEAIHQMTAHRMKTEKVGAGARPVQPPELLGGKLGKGIGIAVGGLIGSFAEPGGGTAIGGAAGAEIGDWAEDTIKKIF